MSLFKIIKDLIFQPSQENSTNVPTANSKINNSTSGSSNIIYNVMYLHQINPDLSPVFEKPLLATAGSTLNSSYWDTVMKTYESKKHKETIIAVLNYINPEIISKYGNSDLTEFSIPHGSVKVNLTIKDGMYHVSSPFLKLPEKNHIPLMRQITEINFSTLNLAQIDLRGDELYFDFKAPLEMCNPYKLYRLLEEICLRADENDDLFIEKFGAKHIVEKEVKKYSPEMVEAVWSKYQYYLKEALEYYNYFESKRMYDFGFDFLLMAFAKIDYVIRPQGFMRAEIEKGLNYIISDADFMERLSKTKATLQKLQQIDKTKFSESMYSIEILIPDKSKCNLENVQKNLKNSYNTAKEEFNKNSFMGATLTLLIASYRLFYYNIIPAKVNTVLVEGLMWSNQKSWYDSAKMLLKAFDKIMQMENKEVISN